MSNVEANVDAKPKARDLLNKIVADHYQGAWDAKNAGGLGGHCRQHPLKGRGQ